MGLSQGINGPRTSLRGPNAPSLTRRLLTGATPTPGLTPATSFALAANRARVPDDVVSVPANYTVRREQWAHPSGAISGLVTTDVGFCLVATAAGFSGSNGYTIKRYIEYPEGVFTPVTWAGQPTATVPGGGIRHSDPVPVTIPAGERFWERTVCINAVSFFPIQTNPTGAVGIGVTDGFSTTDQGNGGTIAPSVGTSGGPLNMFGATAIRATIAAANVRSSIVVGDSIVVGKSDINGSGVKRGSGWLGRALDPLMSYMKVAKVSWTAQQYAATDAPFASLISDLAGSYTDVFFELGLNDIGFAARTAAQVLTDQQTGYAKFPDTVRKYQTNITPISTSSTGSWSSAGVQTPSTQSNMADLHPLNAAIRALPANLTGIVEVADVAMTARDSGIWSGPYNATPDGIHPSTVKAAAMAAAVVIP